MSYTDKHALLGKTAKTERLIEAFRRYEDGMTLTQIGASMRPQVTGQRVGQLLSEGAARGLFADPRPRRQPPNLVDEHMVHDELRANEVRTAAKNLGVSVAWLKAHFAGVVRKMRKARRDARRGSAREKTINDYRLLVERLGRQPTASELRPTALGRRIQRQFGGFPAFWKILRKEKNVTYRLLQGARSGSLVHITADAPGPSVGLCGAAVTKPRKRVAKLRVGDRAACRGCERKLADHPGPKVDLAALIAQPS